MCMDLVDLLMSFYLHARTILKGFEAVFFPFKIKM